MSVPQPTNVLKLYDGTILAVRSVWPRVEWVLNDDALSARQPVKAAQLRYLVRRAEHLFELELATVPYSSPEAETMPSRARMNSALAAFNAAGATEGGRQWCWFLAAFLARDFDSDIGTGPRYLPDGYPL